MIARRTNLWINFQELKYRLIYLILSFIFTVLICFIYRVELFFLISNFFLKYEDGFIYTSLLDPLFIYIKVSILSSLFWVFPIFIYFLGFFFFRAFYNYQLVYIIFYLFFTYFISFLFFVFVSKLFLPILFEFLINFQLSAVNDIFQLKLQATITQYYKFYFRYIYIYLLLILIPNIFLVLVILGLVSRNTFLKFTFRKYLYLIVFILFLIVAPPDFVLQLFILPFIVLFLELYIYLITFFFTLYIHFEYFEERRIRTYDE